MDRIDIINRLIRKNEYKTYLEIGVFNGYCFNNIKVDKKVGVDPDPKFDEIYPMTSDEFFGIYNKAKWDIIFIDGLHLAEQVYRDICNAIDCLNTGGIILVHDCNPPKKEHQEEKQVVTYWSGTVWKGWVKARITFSDHVDMFVINADTGIGIVSPWTKERKILDVTEELTFENLEKNREKWLNLITVKEFSEWLQRNAL